MISASWESAGDEAPDLALLAIAGGPSTPNLDGKPYDGSRQDFVAHMAMLLQPARVILNHHDDWCPPLTACIPEEPFRPGLELAGAALEILRPGGTLELE